MIKPIYRSGNKLFISIITILFAYSITRGMTLLFDVNYETLAYREVFKLTPRVILGGYWTLVSLVVLYSFVSVRAGMWRIALTLAGTGLIHWGTMFFLIRGWQLFDGAATYFCFGAVLLSFAAFARDPRVNQMLRKVQNFERGHSL